LTKIVATLGPASSDEATLARLLSAGVDVVRVNFSHGAQAEHAATIGRVRAVASELGRTVAILQDLQGPKLRVGELEGGAVSLVQGAAIDLVTTAVVGTAQRVSTTYEQLGEDVNPGDRILLDDGNLELRVETVARSDTGPDLVGCRVVHGGVLKPHKGLNLPGIRLSTPSLTAKDLEDLAFGVAQGVDYVALSFVRTPEDLRRARAELKRLGGRQPLIAKIEKPEAISRLDEIVRASDGVMVARGDLGVELSTEAVPMLQKRIIRAANRAGVPVITATQMLESMIGNPRPTRAEASDVANAILDGTDAVMLSGETAVGAYPVGTVEVMDRIAREAERGPDARQANETARCYAREDVRPTDSHAIARAAQSLAENLGARAIAVLTSGGRTARLVSKDRPGVRIVAFTERAEVARRLALWNGVTSAVVGFPRSTDAAIALIEQVMRDDGYANGGERVIIVGSAPMGATGPTNFVQVHHVSGRGEETTPEDAPLAV
jgi:pyruvate kinase